MKVLAFSAPFFSVIFVLNMLSLAGQKGEGMCETGFSDFTASISPLIIDPHVRS